MQRRGGVIAHTHGNCRTARADSKMPPSGLQEGQGATEMERHSLQLYLMGLSDLYRAHPCERMGNSFAVLTEKKGGGDGTA